MPVVSVSTNETSAGAQNFSVPLPAGVQNGHLMIAGYVVGNNIYTVTPPPGWTAFETGVILNSGSVMVSLAWKIKASGDVAPVWSLSTASTAKATGFVVALSGRQATPTFGAHAIRSASGTTTAAPSVTAPAGADLLAIFFDKVSSQTGVAAPAGMTEIVKDIVTGGGAVSAEVAYQAISSAGATGAKTATYDVASSLGYGVLMYAPAATNVAPTVNAGSDQNTIAGVEVTMTGTATDTDGTIASRQWVQTGGPTVSLTGATTATCKFTPVAAGVYTFTFTATDDGGAQGSDSITINVAGNTSRPISVISNAGGFGVVGPAATTWEALADDDDTSYIQSPSAPAGAVYVTKLAPLATGNAVIKTRDKQDVASPVITRRVEVLQGASTVIADLGTFTLTTGWVDHVFALTTVQMAAITDRTDLRLRITDTSA